MDVPNYLNLPNLIDVPGDLLDVQKLIDVPENILNSRYQLGDISELQLGHASHSKHSSHLSRNIFNTPTIRTVEPFSDERPSSSRVSAPTRKQSHSPARPLNSRTSRPSGAGTKHDPYTIVSRPSTPSASALHGLRRKKSSASASTSTAITAQTSLDEIELVREPQHRDSEIYHHYMALAVSDNQPSESVKTFRSLEHRSLVVHEGNDHARRLDKGKMAEQPHIPNTSHTSRRHTAVDSVEEARRAKHERSERYSYSGPLAHAEFERMKKEIESLKKSVHDNKKIAKKQAKVGQSAIGLIYFRSLLSPPKEN